LLKKFRDVDASLSIWTPTFVGLRSTILFCVPSAAKKQASPNC